MILIKLSNYILIILNHIVLYLIAILHNNNFNHHLYLILTIDGLFIQDKLFNANFMNHLSLLFVFIYTIVSCYDLLFLDMW